MKSLAFTLLLRLVAITGSSVCAQSNSTGQPAAVVSTSAAASTSPVSIAFTSTASAFVATAIHLSPKRYIAPLVALLVLVAAAVDVYAAPDSSSSTGVQAPTASLPLSVTFAELCTGDSVNSILNSTRWTATDPGSAFVFTACGVAAVPFVRIVLVDRWTQVSIANFPIAATPITSVPAAPAGCQAYTAPTNLPVIAGKQIKSEMRIVADNIDDVHFIARCCIN